MAGKDGGGRIGQGGKKQSLAGPSRRMKIGDFLLCRLEEAGAGDYNLEL